MVETVQPTPSVVQTETKQIDDCLHENIKDLAISSITKYLKTALHHSVSPAAKLIQSTVHQRNIMANHFHRIISYILYVQGSNLE